MDTAEYIESRLDDQIKWYSTKSGQNQKKHKFWQVIKVIAALSIPVLTLWIDDWQFVKYAIGIMGAFIAFIESYTKIYNFKELWIKYRLSSEQLKRQKILFETKSKPYGADDAFALLVSNCENIMSGENQEWLQINTQEES